MAAAAKSATKNTAYQAAVDSITAEQMFQTVDVLASPKFEGREAGSTGGHAAGDYLVEQLRKLPLKPGGDKQGYFQPFGKPSFQQGKIGRNILALLPGCDPAFKDQTIIVGAHYDHLGHGRPNNNNPPGTIYPGADDNASGSSGVLALARAFSSLPTPPKRTILFVFFDGEEKGLLGSKHWISSPTVPLSRVQFMLNLDMIGALRADRLLVFGTRTAAGMRRMASLSNEASGLTLDFSWQMRADADHYSFYDHGIPAIFLHTDLHERYHRPTDVAAKINRDGMMRVGRFAFSVLYEMADGPLQPRFRTAARAENEDSHRRLEAAEPIRQRPGDPPLRLGVSWRTDDAEPGTAVLIHVAAGSAAAAAGLRAGDRIYRAGGRDFADDDAFLKLVRTSPGPLELLVEHHGQMRTVTLHFAEEPHKTSISTVALLATGTAGLADVRVVDSPATATRNRHYVGNREPLSPSPLLKLPIGSIVPRGWLRHQLELERDGMTGHLAEISPWLDFAKSSWSDKEGRGRFGWEELPYWLKGYGDLGYVLHDPAVIAQARRWIRAAMDSQRDDGWFGPRELLTSLKGKPDLWPHMVMLNVLQSCHEATGDPRAIAVMTRFMKWESTLPEQAFGEGYWPKLRAGDNIESALWLYNRTGEPWLLDLARKIHRGMARWDQGVVNWHNVNVAQGFRAGTVFGVLSKEARDLDSAERNYETVMARYGQQPGGGFVGDENCRPGHLDPQGGFETCGIVELMHSFEMLTRITGLPRWADRCEEIALNTLPAAMTPDEKGLHYITAVNQVQLDRKNKSPGIENRGTMFSYSPREVYRCCQHNVSHGWPYYAEEMWLATADNGLCASLYAPSEVTATVAQGTEVSIREETDYPFRDTVEFKLSMKKAVQFQLYLRVPQWCAAAEVKINGDAIDVPSPRGEYPGRPLSYIVLDRAWKDGDQVTLRLPMQIAVRRWPKNQDAASVSYGPLGFSLAIQERWEKYGDPKAKWPEWEVFPASAWNYGLVLDSRNPAASFSLVEQSGQIPPQPFTPDAAPLALKVKARKVPNWQTDRNQMVDRLQRSPVRSAEPLEEVRLIPMGSARLRLGLFPVIGEGPDAHDWVAPAR